MKSIREKAEENCIKYGNLGNVAYQEFEAGANYVLEEIENLIKTTTGEGEAYHYNLYFGLVNLLEKLKK